MSRRYVYSVYEAAGPTPITTNQYYSEYSYSAYPNFEIYACSSYTINGAKNRQGNSIALYEPSGSDVKTVSVNGISSTYQTFDTLEYPYLILQQYTTVTGTKLVGMCFLFRHIQGTDGNYWHVKTEGNRVFIMTTYNQAHYPNWLDFTFSEYTKTGGTITKGTSLLYTKSSGKSDDEGAFYAGGWKWSVYRGSDTIDPISVSYLEDTLYSGDFVTAQVEPCAPVYGGTVSYQYEYSIDGGNIWAKFGNKTTETSLKILIPEEAERFRVRVLASDNYGFTSLTYVMGPDWLVAQLKAYIGINGKARPLHKIYIGVGGKAREVIRGYIGVNGKARKFL